MASDAIVFDEADLNAFTDGRLEPVRAAALAESLASDRMARARIDGWKRQNDGLRTLFASVLFEPIPVRLLQTTLSGSGSGTLPLSSADIRVPGRGSSAAVLATTAIGVALVGFMAGALATIATDGFGRANWGLRGAAIRPVTEPSAITDRAAETYRAALADPERATNVSAGDEARLQHWMTHQLSGAVRIPDLRGLGWKLLGGRVVPGQFAPAAFLLYGRDAERLGLYLARDPTPSPPITVFVPDGAVVVRAWSEDGLGAALASTDDVRAADAGIGLVRDAIRRQMIDAPPSP